MRTPRRAQFDDAARATRRRPRARAGALSAHGCHTGATPFAHSAAPTYDYRSTALPTGARRCPRSRWATSVRGEFVIVGAPQRLGATVTPRYCLTTPPGTVRRSSAHRRAHPRDCRRARGRTDRRVPAVRGPNPNTQPATPVNTTSCSPSCGASPATPSTRQSNNAPWTPKYHWLRSPLEERFDGPSTDTDSAKVSPFVASNRLEMRRFPKLLGHHNALVGDESVPGHLL